MIPVEANPSVVSTATDAWTPETDGEGSDTGGGGMYPPGYSPSDPSSGYAAGGFVEEDGATVHKGEWVIPTRGGPLLTGDGNRDVRMDITYNIRSIVGVDDFERRMEAHDRELLRKMRAVI